MTTDGPPSRRRATLKQARSRETRQALVRASLKLWSTQGFDETTVDDICSKAGVSKGLFYFYFERKEDLLVEMGWQGFDAWVNAAEALLVTDYELDDLLHTLVHHAARRVERNDRALVARSVIETYRAWSRATSLHDGRTEGVPELLQRIFDDALKRGQLPKGCDTSLLASVSATLFLDGVRRWATGQYGRSSLADVLIARLDAATTGARAAASTG